MKREDFLKINDNNLSKDIMRNTEKIQIEQIVLINFK